MKKLVLSLLLFVGSIISFGSCFDYIVSGSTGFVNSSSSLLVRLNGFTKYFLTNYGIWCNQSTDYSSYISYYTSSGDLIAGLSPGMCIVAGGDGSYILSSNSNMVTSFYVTYIYLPLDIYNGCDLMTSNECQSNYNLIPISDVNQEYCLGNDLCPEIDNGSGGCENESGNVQWSSLFINDIQHIGAGIINITIPEEIAWDYTGNEEIFNVYVSGYNVDTDYIEGIINVQNSKPSQGDLNKLVSEVLPLFIPGLAVVLLLYFIFRFIKKIF